MALSMARARSLATTGYVRAVFAVGRLLGSGNCIALYCKRDCMEARR